MIGFYFGYQFAGKKIAASTIDALIEKGFQFFKKAAKEYFGANALIL